MPECELCGKKTKLVKIKLEDAVLNVCDVCASFGQRIFEQEKKQWKENPLDMVSLNPSYSTIIKIKRESLDMTREELAKKINEKLSVIERIENGKLSPDEKTAKKLEKALNVKLRGYVESDVKLKKKDNKELTIGDIAKIRKRK